MQVGEAIRWAKARFERSNIENPSYNAEMLLQYVLGKKRNDLYFGNVEIPERSMKLLGGYVEKRCMHMPVAYIAREIEFMSLPFFVNEKVFIPRPETEVLVEIAMTKLRSGDKVIDMCTGCGNIAVGLAKYSSCEVNACDISPEAIEIARGNAVRNGVLRLISFLEGDMFGPLRVKREFDLVVSNPPYIRHDEIRSLPEEVRNFEPRIALDGGADGLRYYFSLSRHANSFLKPGGYLIVEVGFDEAQEVCEIFKKHFESIEIIKDYAGIQRVIVAQ